MIKHSESVFFWMMFVSFSVSVFLVAYFGEEGKWGFAASNALIAWFAGSSMLIGRGRG